MSARDADLTPSQTVGPFLAIGLRWTDGPAVVPDDAAGAFWVRGRVLDGQGDPVADALVETWQADPDGRFDHPDDPRGRQSLRPHGFRGFGRSETVDGAFAIRTVKPGPLPAPDGGTEAPHLDVAVFARGLQDRVVTRLYFPDEPDANTADPVLSALPAADRSRLIARPASDGYRFDVVLQGEHESVFFLL